LVQERSESIRGSGPDAHGSCWPLTFARDPLGLLLPCRACRVLGTAIETRSMTCLSLSHTSPLCRDVSSFHFLSLIHTPSLCRDFSSFGLVCDFPWAALTNISSLETVKLTSNYLNGQVEWTELAKLPNLQVSRLGEP
jgi:hypothetical protein